MAIKRSDESMKAAVQNVQSDGASLSRIYNVPLESLRRENIDCRPGPKTF